MQEGLDNLEQESRWILEQNKQTFSQIASYIKKSKLKLLILSNISKLFFFSSFKLKIKSLQFAAEDEGSSV